MGAIESLQAKLKVFNSGGLEKIISASAEKHKSDILYVQKQQLLAGQNSEGKKLTPSYSQDPFFTSPTKGLKYAKFKSLLDLGEVNTSIFPAKDFDTPNLIVTGKLFHNTIFVSVLDKSITIDASSPIKGKLNNKYGNVLGLNSVGWKYMIERYMFKEIKEATISFLQV